MVKKISCHKDKNLATRGHKWSNVALIMHIFNELRGIWKFLRYFFLKNVPVFKILGINKYE